jgi:hypothetical protein
VRDNKTFLEKWFMGWTHTKGATKASIVAGLIADQPRHPGCRWSNSEQKIVETGFDVESKTLAHKVVRNTLWTVCEVVHYKEGKEFSRQRFIGCYLLGSAQRYGWGYKAMDESMEPFYYDCPLSFLDKVPVVKPEWRAKVKEYHQKKIAC